MKKIIYPAAALLFLIIIQSCKKDNHPGEYRHLVIDTTVASGTDYVLNLQPYGDADDSARIVQQGTGYTVSEITNAGPEFNALYHYTSLSKTGLTDRVILSVREGAHNGRVAHIKDSTVIMINFIVK